MTGEDVERVVERRLRLPVHRQVADDARREANENTVRDADVAGGTPRLSNPEWADPALFGGTEALPISEDEPFAANVVLAGDRLIYAAGNPKTARRLRDRGFTVAEVELSELQKAEAGGTCMSLISD